MKNVHLGWVLAIFLSWQPAATVYAASQWANGGKAPENVASPVFEPLDRWKAAVVSGDKVALASLYMTFPAARAKTPQGETRDPAEVPAFWSSVRRAALSRCELKVLEVENLQRCVKACALRYELKLQTRAGVKSGGISGSQ